MKVECYDFESRELEQKEDNIASFSNAESDDDMDPDQDQDVELDRCNLMWPSWCEEKSANTWTGWGSGNKYPTLWN